MRRKRLSFNQTLPLAFNLWRPAWRASQKVTLPERFVPPGLPRQRQQIEIFCTVNERSRPDARKQWPDHQSSGAADADENNPAGKKAANANRDEKSLYHALIKKIILLTSTSRYENVIWNDFTIVNLSGAQQQSAG